MRRTPGAAGYFNYFGSAAGQPGQGYYSFDIGTWHIIALNSNCGDAGGCSATSPQGVWLANDLKTHTNFCTLAFWHIPLFSSGGRANNNSKAFWQLLYDNNADLILSAHDHIYERFAPQTPSGTLDTTRGIREFIVGTGGANHTSIVSVAANSEVRNADTFGVLELTLHPTSYDWQFVPEAGKTFTDSGSTACHGATSDTTPPTAPANLTATAVSPSQVNLSWDASTDNVGVAGYKVYRMAPSSPLTSTTSYSDTTVQAGTSHSYTVYAYDAAGNISQPSNTATVTTPTDTQPPTTPTGLAGHGGERQPSQPDLERRHGQRRRGRVHRVPERQPRRHHQRRERDFLLRHQRCGRHDLHLHGGCLRRRRQPFATLGPRLRHHAVRNGSYV